MIRGDLFVTIAEIHTLILDVCVCLHKIIFGFDHLVSLKMLKNTMLSKANDAIINKINLSQKLGTV